MLVLKLPFSTIWKDKDPFEEVEKLSGELYRSVATRKTIRFEVEGKGYYLKLHHGITYKEFFKNILSLHWPVFGARNEWRAIHKLQEIGVDTMVGVAYGERGFNPIKQTSFIVTEDLSPTISLEDYCENWANNPPPYVVKKALITRVAEMVRKMHESGINHRDCYICHFLLQLPFLILKTLNCLSLICTELRFEIKYRSVGETRIWLLYIIRLWKLVLPLGTI